MGIMAIHAGSVAIIVQQSSLGAIVSVVADREWMAALRDLGEHVGRRRRDSGSSVVAVDAGKFIGAAQQACLSGCIVRHVATAARVVSDCVVPADVWLVRSLVRRCRMDAYGPVREVIDLSVYDAAWLVASETELPSRAVTHEKHRNCVIFALGVRIVAGRALDGALDELYG